MNHQAINKKIINLLLMITCVSLDGSGSMVIAMLQRRTSDKKVAVSKAAILALGIV